MTDFDPDYTGGRQPDLDLRIDWSKVVGKPTGVDVVALMEHITNQREELEATQGALGELIDALADELRFEVNESPHVKDHVQRAAVMLGGPYASYAESWV
jgi:hypothetical protein